MEKRKKTEIISTSIQMKFRDIYILEKDIDDWHFWNNPKIEILTSSYEIIDYPVLEKLYNQTIEINE